jgi:GMP synthase-like glutamine amidotransferase
MRLHVLQHIPFEGLGHIADWAERRRAAVTWTRFHDPAAAALPALANVDFLIVLGGPMSVNDEAVHPWLAAEKTYIASALAAGKPILGICLGAQLIACALGARVRPAPEREIGWFPVMAAPPAPGAFAFPPRFDAFHWHGETFDLPPGAILLAHSEACENQAFQHGPRVIGLQFHLETTRESADALVRHCPGDLAPGRCVQSAADLLADTPARADAAHVQMDRLLDWIFPHRGK